MRKVKCKKYYAQSRRRDKGNKDYKRNFNVELRICKNIMIRREEEVKLRRAQGECLGIRSRRRT